jgi:hypothetical protein
MRIVSVFVGMHTDSHRPCHLASEALHAWVVSGDDSESRYAGMESIEFGDTFHPDNNGKSADSITGHSLRSSPSKPRSNNQATLPSHGLVPP